MGLFDINTEAQPEANDTDTLYLEQYKEYMRNMKFERVVNWVQLIAGILGILMALIYIIKRTK